MFSLFISQGYSMHACPRRGSYCILGLEEISAWRTRRSRAGFRKFPYIFSMHRAHVARKWRARVGLTVYRPSRTFELLFYFFEIKLLRARGSDPESISRNVKTRFQMFINFRNVVILLVILYILIFILVFVTRVHTTHSHPMHANTETVRTSRAEAHIGPYEIFWRVLKWT